MVNFFAGGFFLGSTSFPFAARGLAALVLPTVFIPIDAKGSSSMPPPKPVALLFGAVAGLYDDCPPPPPMFEKAKALPSTSSSSLQPSSASSPQPSSAAGAGFGALNDAAANCCVGGCGTGAGCCDCMGFGAAGVVGLGVAAGAAAVGELIQDEKYPLLLVEVLPTPAGGTAGAGAVLAGAGLDVAAGTGEVTAGAAPVAEFGAPTMGGSPRSVIKFDSFCISPRKSRTTRKASFLTSVIGSNNKGITQGITLTANSCLVKSVFDCMSD
mmetsp:Transcript_16939/g.34962  ORF Transcript_16939/g.34962 Transcript_16939/m.34962 type:complete len:269 (-) Transcript_16939:585-1391(-)|eukprot:CAMPEP_0197277196 /NCGR_PEP_ID=MMETSP1432-20130617/16721_1 /TAXON_ID=44447 /ORGANISM="Pseudo-nitzschia delicatissima, Strain UNC1205" /LENGTH=268 /DNA_ID=CAMNT_0042743367 /DNA_START=81 /DNA_END=887 /DNA_ORIENTATION=-